MVKYTNKENIDVSMAVWLLSDSYDYNFDDDYLSATTLLKPTRMIVLEKRLKDKEQDLSDLIASKIGNAVHDAIERSWNSENLKHVLSKVDFPKDVLDRMVINPAVVKRGQIPIYLEQRGIRTIEGFKIGGKFDICINGELGDFKSTSVYSYIYGSRIKDYILQGSIYRWIHRDMITSNTIQINYIFKDFKESYKDKTLGYPSSALLSKKYDLLSLEATEDFIKQKVKEVKSYLNVDEPDLPYCTDEELWTSEIVYAVKESKTAKKAKKLCKTYEEAEMHKLNLGLGAIIEKRGGEAKRCEYCSVCSICSQYKALQSIK